MPVSPSFWIFFNLFVLVMLAIDLGVFNRDQHEVKVREALIWTGVWVTLACLFGLGIYYFRGRELALQFFAGYLIEESLSVDNLFVFLLIFTYFKVPPRYQHKVLFWGIIGAIVLRATFIFTGITLIHHFHWIFYLLGVFLIITGIKMIFEKEEEIALEKNLILRIFKKCFRMTPHFDEGKFITRHNGLLHFTPLLAVLLIVDVADVIFAVDSIPAILSISTNIFIVYTSNIFAIMGLRSLYFALAGLMQLFHYLNYALSAILVFVGVKMLIGDYYAIPVVLVLGVIVSVLAVAIAASVCWPKKNK